MVEFVGLIQQCYRDAAHDLYVVGMPSIAVVTKDRIQDLSQSCAESWARCKDGYFSHLTRSAMEALAEKDS